MTELLDQLRAVSATLAGFDHAPDHIEVNTRAVSALLAEAATAIAESERAREALRRERNAAMNERDTARSLGDAGEEYTTRLLAEVAGYMDRVEAVTRERDEARAEVARLRELATGWKTNAGPW